MSVDLKNAFRLSFVTGETAPASGCVGDPHAPSVGSSLGPSLRSLLPTGQALERWPSESSVPEELARQALDCFLATGKQDLALHWVRIDAFPRKIFWEGREGRAAWEHASSGTKHDVYLSTGADGAWAVCAPRLSCSVLRTREKACSSGTYYMNPFFDSLFVIFKLSVPNLTKDLRVGDKILVLLGILCFGSVGFAQERPPPTKVELSGGYSVNTDYVASRPVIVVSDQKVSPFFSHGSGPIGFEFSATRYVRGGLGIAGNVSFYSDRFPSGRATSCHPLGCATGLMFEASGQSLYLTLGMQWKFRRDRPFAPFVRTLGGIVRATSRFAVAGSAGAEPFMGGLILFNSAGTPSNGLITYADSNSDMGLALSLGGGFDIRIRQELGLRAAVDYDPTFLVRPVLHDPILDAGGRIMLPDTTLSERNRQDHLRATIGIVWGIR